jgi:hypothetical protein
LPFKSDDFDGQLCDLRSHERFYAASGNGRETRSLLIQLLQKMLDRINFAFLEQGLTALARDPCRHGFERQMVSFAVDMKWRVCPFHSSLAM